MEERERSEHRLGVGTAGKAAGDSGAQTCGRAGAVQMEGTRGKFKEKKFTLVSVIKYIKTQNIAA